MAGPVEWLWAIVVGPFLWLIGAIGFDFVHWLLHSMLRSRSRWLRALAWPHSVHHAWIDRNLEVHPALRRRNVWCHIVPEFVTQLAFSGLLAWVAPLPFAAVVVTLQTLVFAGILRAGGLDINHRPIAILDAYRPGFWTPPAYHALHHVYPDAHFSAYTKLVDRLVGGGAQLADRRFALHGAPDAFVSALFYELEERGAVVRRDEAPLDLDTLSTLDVLIVRDTPRERVSTVESFVNATSERKLPPEIWAICTSSVDATSRHYHEDVRIHYRTIVLAHSEPDSVQAADAARIAVSRILRGFDFVPTVGALGALGALRRFLRTRPLRPDAAIGVRHRIDLAGRS